MKKGNIVKVKAIAYGVKDGHTRKVVSYKVPETTGIVLGYSFIFEGKITSDRGGIFGEFDNWEAPYFTPQKSHKVWVVEPLDKGNRYLEPVRCFEKDIELV